MSEAQTGYVYFRPAATTAQRDALLADYGAQLTAVIHYSRNRIRFDAWPLAETLPAGQAFGPQVEIRWQPRGAAWEVLLLSETAQPGLQEPDWQAQTLKVDAEQRILLWGRHWRSLQGAAEAAELPDGWVAAQIEADLSYPVDGDEERPEVKLVARTYRRKGIVRFTRLSGIAARNFGRTQERAG